MGKKVTTLFLDSNIFIYHFEKHPRYSASTIPLFERVEENEFKIKTSVISVIEALSFPSSTSVLNKIKDKFDTLPNFEVFQINREIGESAARIRRKHKFRLPDSVQLATALIHNADIFITNDKRLRRFNEIPVILLGDSKFRQLFL